MAKRSRQARRQALQRQTQIIETPPASKANNLADETQTLRRKTVDFIQEYAYVFKELRNVIIVTLLMFVVMVGLSYVI
jgi:hypothetical protein